MISIVVSIIAIVLGIVSLVRSTRTSRRLDQLVQANYLQQDVMRKTGK